MADVTNADRAYFAEVGLQAFADRVFHSAKDRDMADTEAFITALGDFLADLMHLADQHGDDTFATALGRGTMHYHDEVQSELDNLSPANPWDKATPVLKIVE